MRVELDSRCVGSSAASGLGVGAEGVLIIRVVPYFRVKSVRHLSELLLVVKSWILLQLPCDKVFLDSEKV